MPAVEQPVGLLLQAGQAARGARRTLSIRRPGRLGLRAAPRDHATNGENDEQRHGVSAMATHYYES